MTREEVGKTLAELRKRANMSREEVAAILDKSPKTIGHWETGHAMPDANMLFILCKIYDADLNEAFGFAPKTKIAPILSDEAMQIAIDYSLLDSYGKRAVRVILKDQQKRMMEEEAAAPHRDNVIPLPKSIQKTSAGRGAYLGPEEMETIMVEENDLTRRASFCVPVSGDSMEPIYHDGDILLVEGREDIEPGQIGVFTVDGDGYVKKRGEGELISLNPDYAPIPLTENSWCNGLVIGVLDKAWIRE